jgi:hypothetical protein
MKTSGSFQTLGHHTRRQRANPFEYEDKKSGLHREAAIYWQIYRRNETRDGGG